MKKTKIFYNLLILLFITSCAENKQVISYLPVKETTDTYDLDGNEMMVIKNIKMNSKKFVNTITNDTVNIIHHLDKTGFHFYNAVAFSNEKKGVIVGGAGLRIRTTTDGGLHWQENRFSKFGNALHSVAVKNDTIFVVGENKNIYRSTNFGKQWEVFDTDVLVNQLLNPKETKTIRKYNPRYYKIKFYKHTGIVVGDYDKVRKAKPIFIKTENNGETWDILKIKGIKTYETGISDIVLLSDKIFLIVTLQGSCYKTIDGGKNWKLLFNNKKTSLNSIDFINENEGFIAGKSSALFYTKDGGKNWNKINLFTKENGVIYQKKFAGNIKRVSPNKQAINISNIKFVNDKLALITLANNTQEFEKDFVYKINPVTKTIQSVLHKKDTTITFKGNAYGLFLLKNNLYVLDSNNLYKIHTD